MNAPKEGKVKRTKKKTPPRVYDAFPFRLREHAVLSRDMFSRHGLAEWEIVRELGEKAIFRTPQVKFAMMAAAPPSLDEQVKLSMAHKSESESDVIALHAQAEGALATLAMMARRGDGKALWHFASIATRAAEGLSQMTVADAAVMRPIARQMVRWPLMRSTHPHNCDSDKTLEAIELGAEIPLQKDKFAKWKPDFAADIAITLYEHLAFIRAENPLMRFPDAPPKPFAEWLPPFEKGTAGKWWTIARDFLLAS